MSFRSHAVQRVQQSRFQQAGVRVVRIDGQRFVREDQSFPATVERIQHFGQTQVALRRQAAVLCDGTVVPCCLDHEGDIPLGNLFRQSLDEILAGDRARAIYEGFSRRVAVEELCKRCGYARRFDK